MNVSSSWEALTADGASNSLQPSIHTVNLEESKDFTFDPDTMINFETCVQLTKPYGSTDRKCNISISADKPLSFSRVIVISESKRAEIFDGSLGEYRFTKSGELLDDSDPDMIMFKIDIFLEKPCHNTLKLHLTGVDDDCWLLGVYVFLSDSTTKDLALTSNKPMGIGNQTRFNIEEMNSLLKTTELSDKAQSFKTLFETFQNTANFPISNIPQIPSLQRLDSNCSRILNDSCSTSTIQSASSNEEILRDSLSGSEACDTKKVLSSDGSNLLKHFNSSPGNFDDGGSGDCKCNHNCCGQQTKVLESSIKELEVKIFNKLSDIEKKQEQKLDQILEMLSSKKCID